MSDWSSAEPNPDRSADESDTGWDSDRSDTRWSADESRTERSGSESERGPRQSRTAGRRILSTLRWAVGVLRDSPLVLVVALAASSVELSVLQRNMALFTVGGDLLRWGVSFLGIVMVAAVAAVVAEDVLEERHRTVVAQVVAVLRSVPALLVTVVGFSLLLYFGVVLPVMLVPILGIAFGLAVGIYLLSLLGLVVPAVVLDQSIRQGRTAFAGARLPAVGLLFVLTLGHAPIAFRSPTLSEPTLAIGLTVWAGIVTGISTLAYTRVYIANCPEKGGPTGPQRGRAQEPRGDDLMQAFVDDK